MTTLKLLAGILFGLFIFASCSGNANNILRNYSVTFTDDEVVVIQSGRGEKILYSIQKDNNTWRLTQQLDITRHINMRADCVNFNDEWLVFSSNHNSNNNIFVFKKDNFQWCCYDKINGSSGLFGRYALELDGNTLLVGEPMENECGALLCYNLNQKPIQIQQKILPSEETSRYGVGFGELIQRQNDWLLVYDGGGCFSEEEKIKYGIKDDENHGLKIYVNGIEEPLRRTSILAYKKNADGEWIYVQDLFYSLPHPPNSILRGKNGVITSVVNPWYEVNSVAITGKTIYLRDFEKYYVFKLDGQDFWKYSHSLSPPFPLFQKQPIQTHQERVELTSRYAGTIDDDGNINVYDLSSSKDWKLMGKVGFIEKKVLDGIKNCSDKRRLFRRFVHIHDNVIVGEYNWQSKQKNLLEKEVTGGISIYEIDSSKKIKEVFTMRAKGNGILSVEN